MRSPAAAFILWKYGHRGQYFIKTDVATLKDVPGHFGLAGYCQSCRWHLKHHDTRLDVIPVKAGISSHQGDSDLRIKSGMTKMPFF